MKNSCDYKSGPLMPCAPLALAYVPPQQSVEPTYEPPVALSRGTLFPGLDLPFMNVVNTRDHTNTPLGEVMAIDFVAHELHLYLDTHPDDAEAFKMLKQFMRLSKEARRRYTEKYGPISRKDMLDDDCFTWTQKPWPWHYMGGEK